MFRGTFGGSNKHACGVKVSPNIGIKTTLNDSEKEKKSLFVCLLFAAFVAVIILVKGDAASFSIKCEKTYIFLF